MSARSRRASRRLWSFSRTHVHIGCLSACSMLYIQFFCFTSTHTHTLDFLPISRRLPNELPPHKTRPPAQTAHITTKTATVLVALSYLAKKPGMYFPSKSIAAFYLQKNYKGYNRTPSCRSPVNIYSANKYRLRTQSKVVCSRGYGQAGCFPVNLRLPYAVGKKNSRNGHRGHQEARPPS